MVYQYRDPNYHPTAADIYNLQSLNRQLGHDLKAQSDLIHELKKELDELKTYVHKTLTPIINESQC